MYKNRKLRVLVITTNELQGVGGGNALLRSLFYSFERQQLFFIHSDPIHTKTEFGFFLSLTCFRPSWRLIKLILLCFIDVLKSKKLPSRQDFVNLIIQGSKINLPKHVHYKIANFSPDVIYAWAGDSIYANLVSTLASKYSVPYVIHFMDNHFELTGKSYIQKIVNDEYRKNILNTVAKANKIFTISKAMGEAYKKIFVKDYEAFHALIDTSSWSAPIKEDLHNVFNITFTGSLENGQINGIKDLAAAVDEISLEGFKIKLTLCLTKDYEKKARQVFFKSKNIKYIRHPEFNKLPAVFKKTNLLLLVYGFDRETIEYYRYSFATKLVPYMLSGRCILGYGPNAIEPINYLQKSRGSYVITDSGIKSLVNGIKFLINNPKKRNKYAKVAYQVGLDEHDLHKNSSRFMRALSKIAESKIKKYS